MLATQMKGEHCWSTLQEPVCASNYTSNTLRLLSALDNEWVFGRITLRPSWDQNGFVYQITLRHTYLHLSEEFILPMTQEVDELLERYDLLPFAA